MRAEAFYTTVFGWTVASSENYVQWGVGGADFGGMVAMDEKFPPEVPPHWLPYFAVTAVDESARTAAGAARSDGSAAPAAARAGRSKISSGRTAATRKAAPVRRARQRARRP